jgi:hypothetical protein
MSRKNPLVNVTVPVNRQSTVLFLTTRKHLQSVLRITMFAFTVRDSTNRAHALLAMPR